VTVIGEGEMGEIYTDVVIRNPSDPARSWTGSFLVDTGAIETLAPASQLQAIGIEPVSPRLYELADGSEVRLGVGIGRMEFMGEVVGGMIAFGSDDVEPLLGVTAMESAGIIIDPRTHEIIKRSAQRMPYRRLLSTEQHPVAEL